MALSDNFKMEYFQLLQNCVLIVEKSNNFKKVCASYAKQLKRANDVLVKNDAICQNAENLIDKSTNSLKPLASEIIGSNDHLNEIIVGLVELFAEKQSYIDDGFKDEFSCSTQILLAKAQCDNFEKEIVAVYGKTEASKIIYEQKIKIVEFERELGVYFFSDEVLRLKQLNSIGELYSTKEQLILTEEDNLNSQAITLKSTDGNLIQCQKTGQFYYLGKIYLEICLPDEYKIRQLNYYKIEELKDCYRLILEEDNAIFEQLFQYQEQVELRLRQKNKK